ncbi:MAG: glycosyltransferase family 4 protein [Phycisphaerae bacterium]
MRIAMLSWESLHSIAVGGVAAHVSELAAAMVRQGHQVHVFTRRAPGQRSHDWIDGVHYHRCNYPGCPEFVDDVNNMCRWFVDRVFDVEDLLGRFDLIHAHDWLTANAMIWIKQGRGHPCVFTVHSTEYARCGNCFPNGRSHRIRCQERAATYWADRVLAVSHATKKELLWMYEVPDSKVSVVYNGVSPHRFDVDIDPGGVKRTCAIGPLDPTVLFCGRLAWQKGPDLLLEAVPYVLKHYSNAKFVFVGDGEMRGSLESRARGMGVGHAVRFLGFRSGDDLVRLFKMSDAVCVPSRNEPFGIVVLEGWSASKPVVATQNGGPSEFVNHERNGLKIFPRPDSVAWGLGTLFGNFEWARWMGRNGRRDVEERFTWDTISRQVLAAYPNQAAAPQVQAAPAPAQMPAEPAQAQMPAEAALPAPSVAASVVLPEAQATEAGGNGDGRKEQPPRRARLRPRRSALIEQALAALYPASVTSAGQGGQ